MSMNTARLSWRKTVSYALLSLFFLYFLSRSINYEPLSLIGTLRQKEKLPDFSYFQRLRILSEEQFPIDGPGRVIVVGDVHGMSSYFNDLLSKLKYDPSTDKLIHVGDLMTKGSLKRSREVLSFMTHHNITGVRGNHDQIVLEWRTWMDWISAHPEGSEWLQSLEDGWTVADAKGADLDTWLAQQKKDEKWKEVPSGWKLFSEHYHLARRMKDEEFQYLLSLPLILYVPSAHAYVVHAGLLSSDPTLAPDHKQQPLAHPPRLPLRYPVSASEADSRRRLMRRLQEESILEKVPQNKEPWVLLNMRSVAKDHTITRSGKEGTPWPELWNSDMSRCAGYNIQTSGKKDALPCLPATVIYGHAASRRLDVNRWSVGLDSACAKGKRLSTLVLGGEGKLNSIPHELFDDLRDIPFGDEKRARVVSVKCR